MTMLRLAISKLEISRGNAASTCKAFPWKRMTTFSVRIVVSDCGMPQ